METVFTIGYGGRSRDDFLGLVQPHGIRTVVDIRLRPDRASMGIWVKAKTPDKGVEKWLTEYDIGYRSLIELGNVFVEFEDWAVRFQHLMDTAGDLLTERLKEIPQPFVLMCAEKKVCECHRQQVAAFLEARWGVTVCHLE